MGDNSRLLEFVKGNSWLLGSYAIALLARRRWLQVVALVSVLAFYGFYYGYIALMQPT